MGGSRASAASSTSHSTSIQFIFIRGRLASIIVRRSLFFDHGASNMEPRSLCFDDFPAGKYAPPQKTTPGELARLPALPFILRLVRTRISCEPYHNAGNASASTSLLRLIRLRLWSL